MPLWNELEGTRVGDRFPLKALLRSEGRTAWFETEDAQGSRAVLSVAESMNDEESLLGRLEAASRIHHPNLIAIRETGSASVPEPGSSDTTPLVYALMEPFDEGLADVLRERPLTAEETGQIADSLLPALEAIHAEGLVHGRVEPASVLATGDDIKLRSDCLQFGESDEGRRDDVRGFAATLYQALTQRKPSSAADASRLPAPFAGVVRSGLSGQSSLADLRRALKGPSVETAVSAAASARAVETGSRPGQPASVAGPKQAAAASPLPAPPPVPKAPAEPARRAGTARTTVAAAAAGVGAVGAEAPAPSARERALERAGARPAGARRTGMMIGIAVAAVLVLLLFWGIFHRRSGAGSQNGGAARQTVTPAAPDASTVAGGTSVHPSEAVSAAMGAPGAAPAQQVRPSGLRPKPSAGKLAATTAGAAALATGGRAVWHVIVYTYDQQAKAQSKADELAQQHADLSPQVFSPTGGKPFLVTLGGAMTREEAFALRNKARAEGMPHDVYAQNFSK